MSVIQKLYPMAERELKDYIAKPKANGYQSLHATQLVPDLTTNGAPVAVEFQVWVAHVPSGYNVTLRIETKTGVEP